MFISLLLYGFGPIGVDLYKRSSMVSVMLAQKIIVITIMIMIIMIITMIIIIVLRC